MLLPVYKKWSIRPEKGEGSWLTSEDGITYLDMTSGIGVVNLGHNNNEVKEAVKHQLDQYWHTSNLFQIPIQEKVADQLVKISKLGAVFFCNSGTEANEAAIKLARKATGKKKIITFLQSFHGRTFGSMAATGQKCIHEGFGPILDGFEYVPYNDFSAVKNAMDEDTAAVMIEMIQGEGGLIPAQADFICKLSELCKQEKILLIIDEVQTGMGRTGFPFNYLKYSDVHPDIVTAAKGLGNGLPIGAMIVEESLKDALGIGGHGSTFGGNPVSLAAGQVVLERISNAEFMNEVQGKSKWFMSELSKMSEQIPLIKEVRGEGLMIGIELNTDAAACVQKLQEKKILVLTAGNKVIRVLPPLTITKEELQIALNGFKDVFAALKIPITK